MAPDRSVGSAGDPRVRKACAGALLMGAPKSLACCVTSSICDGLLLSSNPNDLYCSGWLPRFLLKRLVAVSMRGPSDSCGTWVGARKKGVRRLHIILSWLVADLEKSSSVLGLNFQGQ